jgi:dihydrofolate reductase
VDTLSATDVLLMGRRTYELMARKTVLSGIMRRHPLKLLSTRTLKSGIVVAAYACDGAGVAAHPIGTSSPAASH